VGVVGFVKGSEGLCEDAGGGAIVEGTGVMIFGADTPYCSIRFDNAPRSCCIFANICIYSSSGCGVPYPFLLVCTAGEARG
jgi:hypothetical protein